MCEIFWVAVFELGVIVFELGREHHELTAEMGNILDGFDRCLDWHDHVLFDRVDGIGENLLSRFRKLKELHGLVGVRGRELDGGVQHVPGVAFHVIDPLVVRLERIAGKLVLDLREWLELVSIIRVDLRGSQRIPGLLRRPPDIQRLVRLAAGLVDGVFRHVQYRMRKAGHVHFGLVVWLDLELVPDAVSVALHLPPVGAV